jgi:hypothetical protein
VDFDLESSSILFDYLFLADFDFDIDLDKSSIFKVNLFLADFFLLPETWELLPEITDFDLDLDFILFLADPRVDF